MSLAAGAAPGAWRGRMRAVLTALAVIGAVAGGAAREAAAQRTAAQCGVCHGELELLRQHVPTLARAQELLVLPGVLERSAHGEMSCAECHRGFGRFPHPEQGTSTASCASCHPQADSAWVGGRHARRQAGGEIGAACAACHGVHDVVDAEALAVSVPPSGARAPAVSATVARMNAQCADCHHDEALPAHDPHAGKVACWACHEPHATHAVDAPGALIAPARQAATCGACHDSAAVAWRGDAHGAAVREAVARGGAAAVLPPSPETPVCTACHGAHGMISPADSAAFSAQNVQRCGDCHQSWRETFFGSYHGKAARLGSRAAATCTDCHGAHRIFASDDPRSLVHSANLVQTCQPCHEYARPAFTQYDAHPNVFDWERNWVLTASFWFMNSLLVGVLGVFGLHTLLWWVRLTIDKRRGGGHGQHAGDPRGGE